MASLIEHLTQVKSHDENVTRRLFTLQRIWALYLSCSWTSDIGNLSKDQKYGSYAL
jgi:hypothetical protein